MQRSQSFSASLLLSHRRRPPGPEEWMAIQARINSNVRIIASMTKEMEIGQDKASASVNAYTTILTQTRLLSEVTATFYSALSAIYNTMSDIKDNFFQETNGTGDEPSILGLTMYCHKMLDSTAVAVKNVDAVHSLAIDKLHAVTAEREMAVRSATVMTACVSQLIAANNDARQELGQRNLWGLPTEIWSQIFEEVQLPDKGSPKSTSPMPRGWYHGSRAMLLASVCRAWRYVAIGTKVLWSVISIAPAKQPTIALSNFVKLHLSRMGPLCPSMVLRCDTAILTGTKYREIQRILVHIKRLHQLHFYLHHSVMEIQPDLLYNMLPTPENLILEGMSTSGTPYVHMGLAMRAPKALTLINCDIKDKHPIPLTNLTVEISDGDSSRFENWTRRPINMLECAILRYKNPRTSKLEVRHTASRLWYLETTVSLLCNHILPTQSMPNLRDLVITDAKHEGRTWDDVTEQLGRETRLKRIVITPRDTEDTYTLIGGLGSLPSLTTLEIRGKSVEGEIVKLKEKLTIQKSWSQGLQTVILTDYLGEGKEILDFLIAMEEQEDRKIRIETINCPSLSQDLRRYLFERR